MVSRLSDLKIILDDFRLSYLFDIEDPVPENRLASELESRDFKVAKQRYIVAPPLKAVLLNLATYKGTSVMYQKDSIPSFIGVAGKDIVGVKDCFDTLREILNQIDSTVLIRSNGIEMVTTTKVFSRSIPSEVIPSLGSKKIEQLREVVGGNPAINNVEIVSKDGDKTWLITIAPLLRSPKYFWLRLTYQDLKPDMARVLDLAEQSENMIEKIIGTIEGS